MCDQECAIRSVHGDLGEALAVGEVLLLRYHPFRIFRRCWSRACFDGIRLSVHVESK